MGFVRDDLCVVQNFLSIVRNLYIGCLIQSHGAEIGLLPSASVDNDFRQYDIIVRAC